MKKYIFYFLSDDPYLEGALLIMIIVLKGNVWFSYVSKDIVYRIENFV